MKGLKKLSVLGALAVAGIAGLGSSSVKADSIAPGYFAAITSPVNGQTNPVDGTFFNVDLTSAVYNPGTEPSEYSSALGLTAAQVSADYIYAYLIQNVTPGNDYVDYLSVKDGGLVDAVAEISHAGDSATQSVSVAANVTQPGVLGGTVHWNYGAVYNTTDAPSGPNYSPILLFATSAPPVLLDGTVEDQGAMGGGVVISAFGPNDQGTPLPLPASAWGGLALLGLLGLGRGVRKVLA